MASQRESYENLINYVALRCGCSYRRVGTVLTAFSKSAQACLEEGNDLQIDGICTFRYVHKQGYIYRNSLQTLDDMVERVNEQTDLALHDIRRVLLIYCKRIHELIANGQRVNIKGLCYITPKESDEFIQCDTRVSAVIGKPANQSFYVMTDAGQLLLEDVPQKHLRISLELSDQLVLPTKVVNPEPFSMETVDI